MNTAAARLPVPPGLWSGPLAAPSVGMVVLIAILAFEQLAVATVMPGVAAALDGPALYAAAFGAAVAAAIVGMVAAGRWSDRSGPGAPLAAGLALFVGGLLAAGLAASMPGLVAGRVLQGAGGGMTSVALYVVAGRHYPPALHARLFAAFAAAWVLPAIVGPALAGWVAQQWGWRWVFLAAALGVLPAALLLQRGLAALPASAPKASGETPASLLVAAAVALGAGLLHGGGWVLPVVGVVLLVIAAPRLLPAGSLRARPGLPAVVALRGLLAAAFLASEVVIPLALQRWRGFTPVQAGLVLTVGALGWSFGSWCQSRMAEGTELRRLRLGLSLLALGIAAIGAALWPAVPMALSVAGWIVAGSGIGLAFPTLSVLVLRLAAPERQGAAASALQLSDAMVSALVLAGVGALLTAWPAEAARGGLVAAFALAALLALAGVWVAGRARA